MDWDKTSEAFIGALIGAVLTYATTRIIDHEKHHREAIKTYRKMMIAAEIMLNSGLVMLYKDRQLLHDASQMAEKHAWMSTLPVKIDFDKKILDGLQNQEFANEWLHLCLQTEMFNQLLDDFREYYKSTGDEVHSMALHSDNGNNPEQTRTILLHDYDTIGSFAKTLADIADDIIMQAVNVYAGCLVHADKDRKMMTRFRRLKSVGNYKVPKSERKEHIKKLKAQYSKKDTFKNYGTNMPQLEP